ncbi:MAG: response regulator transcription factor [Eubacteriales bacterium]|nr:response regulator transcription factor [Eubacteriales bacterium]
MDKIYRVLIVDDHAAISEMLTKCLQDYAEFTVIGAIESAADALLYCAHLKPDLLVMDICTANNASGLHACKEIKEKYPQIKVIIITGFNEISYVPRAREAGADAFVYKRRSLSFFISVVRDVMNGGSYFPKERTIPLPNGTAPLSEREIEILRLVCSHMNNKQIAEELYISEHTVKYHKANMLAKTGFKKILDLVYYLLSNGWINPLY